MTWISDLDKQLASPLQVGESELVRSGRNPAGMKRTGTALSVIRNRLLVLSGNGDGGLIIPNGDTAKRNQLSLVDGFVYANTETNEFQMYFGGTWFAVALIDNSGVGFTTSQINLGTVAAGETVLINGLDVARTFFEMNSLRISASGAGPTISTFSLALYKSEATRDAAVLAGTTFDATNRTGFGLVYLGVFTGFSAALTPPIFQDVLGRQTAVEVPNVGPQLFGALLNGDGANEAAFAVALETYPLVGTQAI